MITGIDQWYGEKQDWVKQTGGVTGHYTSMINPNNLYVGLATFICPDADSKIRHPESSVLKQDWMKDRQKQ